MRLGAPDAPTLAEIAELPHVDAGRLEIAAGELRDAALLDGERPTAAGRAMRERLVAARIDGLRQLVEDWQPDENPEIDPLLRQIAAELAVPRLRALTETFKEGVSAGSGPLRGPLLGCSAMSSPRASNLFFLIMGAVSVAIVAGVLAASGVFDRTDAGAQSSAAPPLTTTPASTHQPPPRRPT